MPLHSAGILLWRYSAAATPDLQVLLAHPGGPLNANKDVWGIPKGLIEPGEELREAAYREFAEELGMPVPAGPPRPLGDIRQKGGKLVTAWAIEGDIDLSAFVPGLFEMIWPPRSGQLQRFPEIDRIEWFAVPVARGKMLPAQLPFLDRLEEMLK